MKLYIKIYTYVCIYVYVYIQDEGIQVYIPSRIKEKFPKWRVHTIRKNISQAEMWITTNLTFYSEFHKMGIKNIGS